MKGAETVSNVLDFHIYGQAVARFITKECKDALLTILRFGDGVDPTQERYLVEAIGFDFDQKTLPHSKTCVPAWNKDNAFSIQTRDGNTGG